MRLAMMLLAVVTFVVVAGLTVHLQVRAALRSYELGRLEDEARWRQRRIELLRADVERIYTPAGVFQAVEEMRQARLQGLRHAQL